MGRFVLYKIGHNQAGKPVKGDGHCLIKTIRTDNHGTPAVCHRHGPRIYHWYNNATVSPDCKYHKLKNITRHYCHLRTGLH